MSGVAALPTSIASMESYLDEIDYMVTSTFSVMQTEGPRILELESSVRALTAQAMDGYQRAHWLAELSDNPEDTADAAGMYWDTYFGADKDLHYKRKELDELEQKLSVLRFSHGVLSANLLQVAKQGISIIHGSLSGCPVGRPIGSLHLKDVIWQGRNQALHWEDGKFTAPVQACFSTLAKEQSPKFDDYTKRNMAIDVVNLLGWHSVKGFRTDMMLLAKPPKDFAASADSD